MMIRAEVHLTVGQWMSSAPLAVMVGFEDVDEAWGEYRRIAQLILDRADRKNDLPKIVECVGPFNSATVELDGIRTVSIVDYAKANAAKSGVAEAYPNLRGI